MHVTATQPESTFGQASVNAAPISVAGLLEEQQTLTAVERFARLHEAAPSLDDAPAQSKYYRDLIPLSQPGQGQQYAFEVDLDACSGCKACVSACHHLNGLEEDETWRFVGQLIGTESGTGSPVLEPPVVELPVVQHVTTACHHCLEPGCLSGCPTNAYEKDPDTGIVRHLDDQCFGCQYCTLACPYEVPQYSREKGIVRKCDMCQGRLAAGEAPACVQACPNGAIRISIVDNESIEAKAALNEFLPCTPDSALTKPSTIYHRRRPLAGNVTAAGAQFARPQHAHPPLVAMLTLTQAGVGALAAVYLFRWLGLLADPLAVVLASALGLGALLAGLAVAPLHLGRPHLMFRAVLGWRHSWLSREAIAFGAIPPLAGGAWLYALRDWAAPGDSLWQSALAAPPDFGRIPLEIAALAAGVAALFCSVRIYQFCQRDFWRGPRTGLKFSLTAAVLGLASVALAVAVAGAAQGLSFGVLPWLIGLHFMAAAMQLAYEATIFVQRPGREDSLGQTARLMARQLRRVTRIRFYAGILGGLATPLAALSIWNLVPNSLGAIALVVAAGWGLSLVGELAARHLFFSAAIPLRMPGGIG